MVPGRLLLAALLPAVVWGFSPSIPSGPSSGFASKVVLSASRDSNMDQGVRRRDAVLQTLASAAGMVLLGSSPQQAWAIAPPRGPSKEEMLGRTQKKKTPEEIKAEKEALAQLKKERLEKAKLIADEDEKRKVEGTKDVEIDADLRANYYYPTARKRYLPRVRAVVEEFDSARGKIQQGDWAGVEAFAKGTAEDAKLPLKLYASSITGQGLSLQVSYLKVMNTEAENYEKSLGDLVKAVKSKRAPQALEALSAMEQSVSKYRKAARVDGPDYGIGEFPEDNKLGAAFGNNNPALLKRNIDTKKK